MVRDRVGQVDDRPHEGHGGRRRAREGVAGAPQPRPPAHDRRRPTEPEGSFRGVALLRQQRGAALDPGRGRPPKARRGQRVRLRGDRLPRRARGVHRRSARPAIGGRSRAGRRRSSSGMARGMSSRPPWRRWPAGSPRARRRRSASWPRPSRAKAPSEADGRGTLAIVAESAADLSGKLATAQELLAGEQRTRPSPAGSPLGRAAARRRRPGGVPVPRAGLPGGRHGARAGAGVPGGARLLRACRPRAPRALRGAAQPPHLSAAVVHRGGAGASPGAVDRHPRGPGGARRNRAGLPARAAGARRRAGDDRGPQLWGAGRALRRRQPHRGRPAAALRGARALHARRRGRHGGSNGRRPGRPRVARAAARRPARS